MFALDNLLVFISISSPLILVIMMMLLALFYNIVPEWVIKRHIHSYGKNNYFDKLFTFIPRKTQNDRVWIGVVYKHYGIDDDFSWGINYYSPAEFTLWILKYGHKQLKNPRILNHLRHQQLVAYQLGYRSS